AVSADKSKGNQVSPIGTPMRSFREKRHDETDQKGGRQIDHERAIRKPGPQATAHIASCPKAEHRPQRSPQGNDQIFGHMNRSAFSPFGLLDRLFLWCRNSMRRHVSGIESSVRM